MRLEVAAVAGEDLLEVGGVDVVLEARRGGALVVAEVAGERLDLVVHGSHVLVQAGLGRRPGRGNSYDVHLAALEIVGNNGGVYLSI